MYPNEAATQYGDAQGTVSIDWGDRGGLHEWARDLGAPENYFPLSLSLYLGELHAQFAGKAQAFSVTIYAADKAVVGETADEIIAYVEKHGSVPVRAFEGAINLEDFPKYIKRFNVVAKSKGILGEAELTVEEE